MASRVGRNDLCPCGSGKKYKQCCEKSGVLPRSRKLNQILAGLFLTALLVAAASAYISIGDDDAVELEAEQQKKPPITLSRPTQPTKADLAPKAAPSGPAPEGKVWNAAHGHWHDESPAIAGDLESKLPPLLPLEHAPGLAESTKPPGPAPAGKEWNTEHGHWHDIGDNSNNAVSAPSAEPTSPAPREGMTWNPEHGHWHGAPGDEQMQRAGREFEERFGRKFGADKGPDKQQAIDQSRQKIALPKLDAPKITESPRDSS